MKIWTVTFNDDHGVDTQVVTSQQEADALKKDWLEGYADEYTHIDFDQSLDDIFDALCEELGFMDSCTIVEHEVPDAS